LIENLSPIYKGLIDRNRTYASFKKDELNTIYLDVKSVIDKEDWILDPMSGCGGVMTYFGKLGYKTYNIEINPPAYYWQVLVNPKNSEYFIKIIKSINKNKRKLPKLKNEFSINDTLFTVEAYEHIKKLFSFIKNVHNESIPNIDKLSIAILLPFVARFSNYITNTANLNHFKEGGFCSYSTWSEDFFNYIKSIEKIIGIEYSQRNHINVLDDILEANNKNMKFRVFITSPPYPNYKDYSKIFKIENRILKDVFMIDTNFNNLMGSNNVSGKISEPLLSKHAKDFLEKFLIKSKILNRKSRRDIEVYYHPYFSIYFSQLQKALINIIKLLTNDAVGYIVVNDNIARDIIVPVGETICDIYKLVGFQTQTLSTSQIPHYGNIGTSAKRINSFHTRHIIKVWKK
jgi:hypothetical protein